MNTPAQKTVEDHFQAARAARFAWLEKLCKVVPAHGGDLEPLRLIHEARFCYIEGRFMATILTTAAYVEHTLVEELEARDLTGGDASPSFDKAIALARKNKLLGTAALEKIDALRLVRNPLTHRKPDGHAHSVRTRMLKQKRAPESILEDDARLGLEAMHGLFFASLRPDHELTDAAGEDEVTALVGGAL